MYTTLIYWSGGRHFSVYSGAKLNAINSTIITQQTSPICLISLPRYRYVKAPAVLLDVTWAGFADISTFWRELETTWALSVESDAESVEVISDTSLRESTT